jgi:hypothetical protein
MYPTKPSTPTLKFLYQEIEEYKQKNHIPSKSLSPKPTIHPHPRQPHKAAQLALAKRLVIILRVATHQGWSTIESSIINIVVKFQK